jgi:hypothetical protein
MAFPIVAPSFLREYVDLKNPENNDGKVRYIITPHSVDYVVMLQNQAFCKRLIEQKEPIRFTMTDMSDEDAANFEHNAALLVQKFPIMTHYWSIRQLMMYILQFRDYNIDRRMLILNHCMNVINGMQSQFQQDKIPEFCVKVTHTADFTDVFNYFDKLPVSVGVALTEGVGFLKFVYTFLKEKGVPKAFSDYKRVYERVFKGLGVSGPETLNMTDMKSYMQKRSDFAKDFQGTRNYILENLLINILWEYAVPFTNPLQSIWENFTFYVHVYNALKILIVTAQPTDDDDLVNIIGVFDRALAEANGDNRLLTRITTIMKHNNTANNGDMAIIAIS